VTQPLLLDANLPPSLVGRLAASGVVAAHVGEIGLGSASDEVIVEHARARGDLLVTHDLDFSRILAASGETAPSVIVLRLRQPKPTTLAQAINTALTRASDDLRLGAIVTVEDSAIRVRMLPVAGPK
jgi:predicted nuclease of predicted toxin-antitoxin system